MVAHSQREWILIGIAECCASRGFEATTVEDVCAAAGVSCESFEQEFGSLEECLGAAVELFLDRAWRVLDGVHSRERPWTAVLRGGVAALLDLLAERPALARLALVEAPAAGGRAAMLHASAKAALLDFLERGRPQAAEPNVPASAARGALAGAEVLVVRELLVGRGGELPAQAPAIVYMLTVPFLEIGEARNLAGGAGRRRHRHLRAVA